MIEVIGAVFIVILYIVGILFAGGMTLGFMEIAGEGSIIAAVLGLVFLGVTFAMVIIPILEFCQVINWF
jgi:hypothetical protein